MLLGIIDVGTNSIHLLIGLFSPNGTFRVIRRERKLIRLGDGLSDGRLTRQAMHRAFEVLARYAKTLRRYGVAHVEAVATSAVREAKNGRAFVRRVRSRLGLPLRIISGLEEARLVYRGVLQAARVRGPTVLVTIGGGSAQVVVGDRAQLRYANSMPLGAARLSRRFIHHDPPAPKEVEALYAAVRRRWTPVIRAVRRHRWHRALAGSAMIHQLMMAAYRQSHPNLPKEEQRLYLTQESLRRLVRWLAQSTARQRAALPGLDSQRQDLALATGVALLVWMEGCEIFRLSDAPGSIREGLIMDLLRPPKVRYTYR